MRAAFLLTCLLASSAAPTMAQAITDSESIESILQRLDQLERQSQPNTQQSPCPEVFTSRQGVSAVFGLRAVQARGVHFPVVITGNPNPEMYKFDFETTASPYVEAEWVAQGSGFGLRSSYWHSESRGRAEPDKAANPLFGLSMTTDIVDLELTQDIDFGFASLLYTTGVRYLSTRRETNQPNITLRTPRFEGLGPILSYEFRRPLRNMSVFHFRRPLRNMSVFHSFKAGLIYGEEEHIVIAPGNLPDPQTSKGFFAIGDIEAGLECHELFGTPIDARATCFGAAIRDVAYLGLHFHLVANW